MTMQVLLKGACDEQGFEGWSAKVPLPILADFTFARDPVMDGDGFTSAVCYLPGEFDGCEG